MPKVARGLGVLRLNMTVSFAQMEVLLSWIDGSDYSTHAKVDFKKTVEFYKFRRSDEPQG